MRRRIPDPQRRAEACKKETLEDAVEYLLEEYDLKGANPYTRREGKFTLAQLVNWLKKHKQMKNKSERRRSDILRNVLNEMMSIVRVGSTRKAMYSFDSIGSGSEAQEFLNEVLRALLEVGGEAEWKALQETLKIDKTDGMTHLEFNSAVNYLVDNGVVERLGVRPARVDGVLIECSRRVVCTPKAWGWDTGLVRVDDDENVGMVKVGGSTKKTHSIALTERTSQVLDALSPILDTLPDTDNRKPANINRSTIVEVALWTLYRQIKILEGEGSDHGEVTLPELAQQLVELTDKINKLTD